MVTYIYIVGDDYIRGVSGGERKRVRYLYPVMEFHK